MLACQRPAALQRPCTSSSSLQARPAAALPRPSQRLQQPSQRNAALLRPAGLGSARRSSRPLTVAQAGQPQGAGAYYDVCGPAAMRAGAMRLPSVTAAAATFAAALSPPPLAAPHSMQWLQQQQRSPRSRAAAWGARSRWPCCLAPGTCSTSSSTCETALAASEHGQHLTLRLCCLCSAICRAVSAHLPALGPALLPACRHTEHRRVAVLLPLLPCRARTCPASCRPLYATLYAPC